MRAVKPRSAARSLLALCLLPAQAALALDWGLDARAGFVHSDNVAQAPEPLADSAAIGTLELHGVMEHFTRTLQVDAEATHAYRYFFDDAYDAENRSQLRSALEWRPVGEFLTLAVSDTYGQLALNPAEGLLPSQYQNANVLTAGPTFTLPLGRDTRILLQGEYRKAHFEDSPVDTQRKYGQLVIERDLSRLFSVYAAGSVARVDFDVEGLSHGYDVDAAEAGINAVGRRTSLGISAGVDRLESMGGSYDGSRFQLSLERRLSRQMRLFASARREITDAADVFTLGQVTDPALTSIRDVQVTPQPLVRTHYRSGLVWSGNRVDLSLQGGYIAERFGRLPQDPLLLPGIDRNVRELGAGATYRFAGGSTLGLNAETLRERFVSGASSDDLLTTLTYRQDLTDQLNLELRGQQVRRTNSPRDFDELRLFVFLEYVFREAAVRESVFDRALERRTERMREQRGGRTLPGGDGNGGD